MDGGIPEPSNMSIVNSYKSFMERNSDPRTEHWWMMSGPGPLITLLASYLYFCTSVGPRYMRDRKPFALKHTIIVYNTSQILMSIYLVYEGLISGWWNDYNFACQPVDYSNNPKANRMAGAVWWYFMAKIIELLDTVFFVLRKKNRQISFLHLYHHTMMPICAWIGTKFLPGGHGTLLGVINSFIHIIMYTYYLISGLGPQYQKYIWWKRHLTTMQLIQFCIIFYHNFAVMFCECNYPKSINFLLSLNAGAFLYMFGNFYVQNYLKKPITRNKPSVVANGNGVISNGYSKEYSTRTEPSAIANGNGVISNGYSKEYSTRTEPSAIANGNGVISNGYSKEYSTRTEPSAIANGNGVISNGYSTKSNGYGYTNGKIVNGHAKSEVTTNEKDKDC